MSKFIKEPTVVEANKVFNIKGSVMSKYIKKPVIVDAIQWDGSNIEEASRFGMGCVTLEKMASGNLTLVVITSSESEPQTRQAAAVGDWLIRDIRGAYCLIKPETFEATFDPYISESERTETVTTLPNKPWLPVTCTCDTSKLD